MITFVFPLVFCDFFLFSIFLVSDMSPFSIWCDSRWLPQDWAPSCTCHLRSAWVARFQIATWIVVTSVLVSLALEVMTWRCQKRGSFLGHPFTSFTSWVFGFIPPYNWIYCILYIHHKSYFACKSQLVDLYTNSVNEYGGALPRGNWVVFRKSHSEMAGHFLDGNERWFPFAD